MGTQALSLVREWRPNVIVLDGVLPKVDGLSLLPNLRGFRKPIIVLSALGEIEHEVRGFVRFAADYIG